MNWLCSKLAISANSLITLLSASINHPMISLPRHATVVYCSCSWCYWIHPLLVLLPSISLIILTLGNSVPSNTKRGLEEVILETRVHSLNSIKRSFTSLRDQNTNIWSTYIKMKRVLQTIYSMIFLVSIGFFTPARF